MDKDVRKPTAHNMKRRSHSHDYSRSGYYHITISTTKALHQPLGQIAGRLDKPDGDSDAPHVVLSPLGQMVEQELRESIQRHYPMLEVMDYVVMPEHLHFLLVAHRDIVSNGGKPTHLGQVIAGFKYGCNKRYWAMTGRAKPGSTPAATAGGTAAAPEAAPPAAEPPGTRGSVLGDSVAKLEADVKPGTVGKPGAVGKLDAPPLFDAGYCDVMPIDEAQLATQRAYIRANPRSRLLRTTNRQWLQPQRNTVNTAVSIRALKGYLQRECPRQMTPNSLSTMPRQMAPDNQATMPRQMTPDSQATMPQQMAPDGFAVITQRLLQEDGYVVCDSYGNVELLHRKLLPIVCHRKDAALFEQQKARCLAEAAAGAVLVSARISQGEQDIMDAASTLGFPVVRIEDNGFPDIYHPSAQRMDDCASGRLLLITPWSYQLRSHTENITTLVCKTMNCIAQAVCRQKDDWWK
jgi:hypothetical protein